MNEILLHLLTARNPIQATLYAFFFFTNSSSENYKFQDFMKSVEY